MLLRLVAFPGFLTISSASRLVHTLSLVVLATVCLLILGSLGAIISAQWAPWNTDCQMWNHIISMYTGGTNTRASGLSGYVPQLQKYQGFCFISYKLKELYCSIEAPLDVLKFELWFIIGDLNKRTWMKIGDVTDWYYCTYNRTKLKAAAKGRMHLSIAIRNYIQMHVKNKGYNVLTGYQHYKQTLLFFG